MKEIHWNGKLKFHSIKYRIEAAIVNGPNWFSGQQCGHSMLQYAEFCDIRRKALKKLLSTLVVIGAHECPRYYIEMRVQIDAQLSRWKKLNRQVNFHRCVDALYSLRAVGSVGRTKPLFNINETSEHPHEKNCCWLQHPSWLFARRNSPTWTCRL